MIFVILAAFVVITAILLFPSQLATNKQQLKAVEMHFDIRQHQLKIDYQFRRKELLRRYKAEDVSADELSQLLDELDQETASSIDTALNKKSSSQTAKSFSLAALLVLIVTIIAANSYWQYGNPELAEEKQRLLNMMEQNPAAIDYLTQQATTQKSQKAFLELLHAARLQIDLKPLDPKSWFQFGEVQASLGRSDLAIQALRRARQLDPKNNQIKLALSRELIGTKEELAGKEAMLLDKDVLKEQPDNEKALLGLGFSAFNAGDYKVAIESWEKVLKNRDPDSKGAQLLLRSIQTAKLKLADKAPNGGKSQQLTASKGGSVVVKVVISDEVKSKLKGNEILFVFARAASGPPMPLAAVRFAVTNIPDTIHLSDKDAMRPELKLSSFDKIQLVARISQSGTALAQKGDYEAKSESLSAPFTGKSFTLTIEHQL